MGEGASESDFNFQKFTLEAGEWDARYCHSPGKQWQWFWLGWNTEERKKNRWNGVCFEDGFNDALDEARTTKKKYQ